MHDCKQSFWWHTAGEDINTGGASQQQQVSNCVVQVSLSFKDKVLLKMHGMQTFLSASGCKYFFYNKQKLYIYCGIDFW